MLGFSILPQEEISPIRNAVETVDQKIQQLRRLIGELSRNTNQNINPLSMALNGVIDAAVMGGIAKYQEAFLNDGYLLSNPDDEDYVNALQRVITQQVRFLSKVTKISFQIPIDVEFGLWLDFNVVVQTLTVVLQKGVCIL